MRYEWRRQAGRYAGLLSLYAALGAVPAGVAADEREKSADTVLAQVGQPIDLAPPAPDQQGTGQQGTAGPSPDVLAPEAVDRAPAGIEIAPLPEARTDYAGTLGADQGGFGTDMWRGTDRMLVTRLLPSLPATTDSPAMQDLMRRLLLSSAEAPEGEGGRNLIPLRAERLAAKGDLTGAADLLRLLTDREADPTTARLRLDALLFANDVDAACAEVDKMIRQFDDTYWQKALIFCQTRAGRLDEAALGLGLLREQGGEDTAFFTLADALAGVKDATVTSLPTPSALHLAMMRAAGQTLPESVLESEDPAVLAAVAANPDSDPALRLAAAERAVAAGALPADMLMRLYGEQKIDPSDLDNVLSFAEQEPGPYSRAALYQAAGLALQPVARATVLQKALELARRKGGYATAVRVNLPFLMQLAPTPELAWFALDAGRALHFAGRHDSAEQWLSLAQAQAARDPQAAAAASALWLLTRIAGGGEPLVWDKASVTAWRDNQSAAGDDKANQRAARIFAIFEAFGEPVGAAWQVLADAAPPAKQTLPDPALWFTLDDAATADRVGETVLLSLLNLGPAGPGAANPVVLSQVLSSLRAAGLEADARALAIETAVANGV